MLICSRQNIWGEKKQYVYVWNNLGFQSNVEFFTSWIMVTFLTLWSCSGQTDLGPFMGSWSGYWRIWPFLDISVCCATPPPVCWDNLQIPCDTQHSFPEYPLIPRHPPLPTRRPILLSAKISPPASSGSLAHVADGGLQMKYAAIRSYFSVLSLLRRAGAKRKGPRP